MKKVGILTFHCADNYGAVLQCYAMQKYLESLGCGAEVINYIPSVLEEKYRPYTPFLKTLNGYKRSGLKRPFFRAVKSYGRNIYFIKRSKKHGSFERFRKKYLKLSDVCKSHKEFLEIVGKYDLISVGSDQVWSKRISGGEYDKVYFLDGVDNTVKKISYAASAGSLIEKNDEAEIASLVENFDCISAREESLAKQLTELTGKGCVGVLDPVFLLNYEQWINEFSKKNPYKKKKYILAYNVSIEPTIDEYFKLVDEVAAKLGCEIYEVGATKHFKGKGKVLDSIGPEEFIQLIEGAEFVFTTSFHATALAILFEKQFNVFLPDNASRIIDILKIFKLENKIINSGEELNYQTIDYDKLSEMNEHVKAKSKEYIIQNLNY
ncbi:MAG: polysaccharide pyruvyl transferase family protein [Ruminococcaceae bacterium]|nr:polysaccharide pyruvyl transferase family protein [Oscillospiraceae bacterium]